MPQIALPFNMDAAPQADWLQRLSADAVEAWGGVRTAGPQPRLHLSPRQTIVHADALDWMRDLPPCSVHAVVTDPPYGVSEYEGLDHEKLRAGRGGVWRIPPAFDGARRRPVPSATAALARRLGAFLRHAEA